MKSRLSNIKIRDDCTVYVGGNNGGNLQALSYIEIGKHENESYKYNNCATNRKKDKDLVDKNNEIDIDDGNTAVAARIKRPRMTRLTMKSSVLLVRTAAKRVRLQAVSSQRVTTMAFRFTPVYRVIINSATTQTRLRATMQSARPFM